MKGIKVCKIFGISIEIHWSWFLLLGGFLLWMAPVEYRQLLLKQNLEGLTAKEVMDSIPKSWMPQDLSRELTCKPDDDLFSVLIKVGNKKDFVVFVVENGEAIGMITKTLRIK